MSSAVCSICLDSLLDEAHTPFALCCGHIFHRLCINEVFAVKKGSAENATWAPNCCPICKTQVNSNRNKRLKGIKLFVSTEEVENANDAFAPGPSFQGLFSAPSGSAGQPPLAADATHSFRSTQSFNQAEGQRKEIEALQLRVANLSSKNTELKRTMADICDGLQLVTRPKKNNANSSVDAPEARTSSESQGEVDDDEDTVPFPTEFEYEIITVE